MQAALLNPKREHQIGNSKERPGDVHVDNWNNGRPAEFDIAVVSPTLFDRLPETSKEAGFAAADYEQYKIDRYSEICEGHQSDYIPLVFETHGAIGERGISVIRSVAAKIANKKNISFSVAQQQTFQQIQLTLVRKNARCILSRLPG